MMATFPRAASPSQQSPGPEDENLRLDEYDLYSLAHSHLDGKTGIITAPKLCGDDPPVIPTPAFEAPRLHPPHLGLSPRAPGVGGRKGRTKKEAAANTNRPSPGGHERKLLTKLQNTERKRRGARP